jgi:basic membrane protein A
MAIGVIAGVPVSAGAADETVCLVADTSGFDDGSFNELALKGLERADRRLGIVADAREPAIEGDIPIILDELVVSGHCDLIIGVGFIVGGYMEPLVPSYPDQRFAVVDSVFSMPYSNVAALLFRADQASFLAGYVAARISATGAIGVYGGRRFRR